MQGHAQIPIINADKKLVGMVYQSDLIKVLNDKMVLNNTTE
jgi:CBS-domain-containing membrane protein